MNVPKKTLVSALAVASQNKRLAVPRALPSSHTLTKEIANFRAKITPSTGHVTYEPADWRSGSHDDLLLATALACWAPTSGAGAVRLLAPSAGCNLKPTRGCYILCGPTGATKKHPRSRWSGPGGWHPMKGPSNAARVYPAPTAPLTATCATARRSRSTTGGPTANARSSPAWSSSMATSPEASRSTALSWSTGTNKGSPARAWTSARRCGPSSPASRPALVRGSPASPSTGSAGTST